MSVPFAALGIFMSLAASQNRPLAPASDELLVDLPRSLTLPENSPEIRSARAIAVRIDLLEEVASTGQGRFRLALGETDALVHFDSVEATASGGFVLSGAIDGETGSSVMFSVQDQAVAATIRNGSSLWTVRQDAAAGGVHGLFEIDASQYRPCGTGADQVVHSAGAPNTNASGATEGQTADVLVAYSPQARSTNGGTNGILALINLAVSETNGAYANSLMDLRIRLVHAVETADSETNDMIQVIQRLRNNGDGWYDEVHPLRDQYGADFVTMIVANGNFCGVGYLMQNVSKSFASSAFSVTLDSCATGNFTFGHELGHNMGCHHDRANASTGAYPYSYGYRTPNNAWRTVMAYSPGTRIQYFSTPDVSFGGFPLGIAHPDPDSAHNARGLEEASPTFAQFRCAIPVPYGTGMPTSQGPELTLGFSGSPQADGSGNFTAEVSNALPSKVGLLFYGFDSASIPLVGGTLYVEPPLTRLVPIVTDAGGNASYDFIADITPVIGEDYYLQFWGRDNNNPAGQGSALSNGLRVDVCD